MAILDGIFGFAAKPRGDMGAAVVNRLLKFATKAGRVVSSLITVDDDGNLSTPGTVIAGGDAKVHTSGGVAGFGHASATYPALRQYNTGEAAVTSATTLTLIGDAGGGNQAILYISSDVTQFYRGPNSGVSLETSAVLQVDGEGSKVGGFLPPRLDATGRGAISSPATGLIIFNTTAGRLELYNGAAWVGFTTVP